ncbi:hypothetical protein B9Z55_003465 [Caenorhabditis nigoni]|uniref:Uncharacterized protein n=1 Tax=Caenorhabditis nigoni TaxID=1611254 RepID=A0A2G5VQI4_9PELO|nr:hypothetical protein B9Z55_003465 [Caenorhabditis nigoni]
MSDSSKSVQKSFERGVKFGEKEPKEEVFSDDEPARKRSRNSAYSEFFHDSTVISEIWKKCENSKNMVEEMGLWMKKLEKLHDEDIDSLKKSINDLASNLKQEFAEKLEKMEKVYQEKIDNLSQEKIDENSKSQNADLKKAEEVPEKMTLQFTEMAENLKREFAEKINKIEKLHQEEVSKLKKNYESKISKLQTAHEKKAEEFENFRKEMEISGKLSISHNAGDTLYGKQFMIMSDFARIPPTKSELEFLFKCIFCKSENHKSIDCRVVADHLGRKDCLRAQNRCIKCLEPENPHMCPRALVACSNCVISPDSPICLNYIHLHHPIVCQYNDLSPYREARRQASNRDRIKSGLKPRFT